MHIYIYIHWHGSSNLGSNSGLGAAATFEKLASQRKAIGLVSDCARTFASVALPICATPDRGVAVTACVFTGQ